MNKMKHLKPFLIVLLVLGLWACDADWLEPDYPCGQCYGERPMFAELYIELTQDSRFNGVPLIIYRDKLEDGLVEIHDTVYSRDYYLWVRTDEAYSAKAIYEHDGKTIEVVDGTFLEPHDASSQCDTVCWVVKGDQLDVRLYTH